MTVCTCECVICYSDYQALVIRPRQSCSLQPQSQLQTMSQSASWRSCCGHDCVKQPEVWKDPDCSQTKQSTVDEEKQPRHMDVSKWAAQKFGLNQRTWRKSPCANINQNSHKAPQILCAFTNPMSEPIMRKHKFFHNLYKRLKAAFCINFTYSMLKDLQKIASGPTKTKHPFTNMLSSNLVHNAKKEKKYFWVITHASWILEPTS